MDILEDIEEVDVTAPSEEAPSALTSEPAARPPLPPPTAMADDEMLDIEVVDSAPPLARQGRQGSLDRPPPPPLLRLERSDDAQRLERSGDPPRPLGRGDEAGTGAPPPRRSPPPRDGPSPPHFPYGSDPSDPRAAGGGAAALAAASSAAAAKEGLPPRAAAEGDLEEEEEVEEGEMEEGAMASVVVGDLSQTWMEEAYVQHLLSGYGFGAKIAGCRVARDFSTGASLGYAIVQLQTARAARKLMRQTAGALQVLHPHRFTLRNAKHACTVYIGALDMPFACATMLRFLFADEPIANTHMPLDERGACRGYGFVTFTTDAAAQRIIRTYQGRPLGSERRHPLKWAAANLLPVGSPPPSMAEEGSSLPLPLPACTVEDAAAALASAAAAYGHSSTFGPPSCYHTGGGAAASAAPAPPQPATTDALAEHASAQLREAKALHAEAQDGHAGRSTEARLELIGTARRLLEGVIAQLTSSASSASAGAGVASEGADVAALALLAGTGAAAGGGVQSSGAN